MSTVQGTAVRANIAHPGLSALGSGKSGAHNQGTIPGTWSNAFHVYGALRKASSTDVYWDGALVKSYATDDNGQGEELLVNVGNGNTHVYGTGSRVLVDYVRVFAPN